MNDEVPLTRGHVAGHRFQGPNKALQLQVVGHASGDPEKSSVGFGDAFGHWCLVAVPPKPKVDAKGNVSSATEAMFGSEGDDLTVLGTRDVRVSKFGQDVKEGEFALINEDGHRLYFGKRSVAWTAFGGFIGFDKAKGTIGIVGIPPTPGGAAPYLTIDATSIGLVSATGASSLTIDAANVTVSGAAIALNAGRINLGVGAADPVVTHSTLLLVLAQLVAQINAHYALGAAAAHPGGAVTTPLVLVAKPNTRVFAPAI